MIINYLGLTNYCGISKVLEDDECLIRTFIEVPSEAVFAIPEKPFIDSSKRDSFELLRGEDLFDTIKDTLTVKQLLVFSLFFLYCRSQSEIVKIMDINQVTIQQALVTSIAKVRAYYRRRGL